MSLVTTPGASNADSYATAAELTTYAAAFGITYASSPLSAVEAALRRGTAYLENQYRGRWVGYRTNEMQSLSWPRIGAGGDSRFRYPGRTDFFVYGVIDADGFEIGTDIVPVQVKNAAMEAALLVLGGVSLEPVLARGGRVHSQSDTVGPISSTTVYEDGSSPVDRYTVIEGLLRGLAKSNPGSGAGNVELVRA